MLIDIGEVAINDADGTHKLRVMYGRYAADMTSLALMLHLPDGRPYARVSVFVEGVSASLPSGTFVMHHDCTYDPSFVQQLVRSGLITDTGHAVDYGFVKGAPIYRLRDWAKAAERFWSLRPPVRPG